MDENDTLSISNKIPLGHNRTNGTVYSQFKFKVEILYSGYLLYTVTASAHINR